MFISNFFTAADQSELYCIQFCRLSFNALYAYSYLDSGPISSQGTYSVLYMCVVPDALEHIRGKGNPLIDETTCSEVGQPLNEPSLQQLQVYPPKNVIFYAQIPYMRRHVMIRLFHFVIANLGISFTSSDYTSTVMSERPRERERERERER